MAEILAAFSDVRPEHCSGQIVLCLARCDSVDGGLQPGLGAARCALHALDLQGVLDRPKGRQPAVPFAKLHRTDLRQSLIVPDCQIPGGCLQPDRLTVSANAVQECCQNIQVIGGVQNCLERPDRRMRQRQFTVHDPGNDDGTPRAPDEEALEGKIADRLVTGQPVDIFRVEQQRPGQATLRNFGLEQVQPLAIHFCRKSQDFPAVVGPNLRGGGRSGVRAAAVGRGDFPVHNPSIGQGTP